MSSENSDVVSDETYVLGVKKSGPRSLAHLDLCIEEIQRDFLTDEPNILLMDASESSAGSHPKQVNFHGSLAALLRPVES